MSCSKYKRKTDRQSWDQDAMLTAVGEVISGAMGYYRAAKLYNVPQTTLENRVKKVKEGRSILEATQKDYYFAPSETTERAASEQHPNHDGNLTLQTPERTNSSFNEVSPADIIKLHTTERKVSNNRRTGRTAVLTSSPYKEELLAATAAKQRKQKRQEGAKSQRSGAGSASRKLFATTSRGKTKLDVENDSSSEEELDDTSCLYCNELYSNSVHSDGWIQCIKCKNWAHELCNGADEDDDTFTCDFCQ